jgi:signal peptidase I
MMKKRTIVAIGYRLLPLPLTVATMRWLVPPVEQPIMVAAATLLLFSALAEYWSGPLFGAPPVAQGTEHERSHARRVLPTLVAMAVAAVVAVAVGHLFRTARVVSTSMVPTILPADRLWVDRLGSATKHLPRRGEIIVFRHRGDGDADGADGALVKRVVGLPGDRISMIDSRPVLNGEEVPSCDAGTFVYLGAGRASRGHLVVEWLDRRPYLTVHEPGPQHMTEYIVKPGELFVLGDNRGVSNDSRSWHSGPGVALGDVEGRVAHVLYGADRAGRLDGERWWRSLGIELHVSGVDLTPLRAGIEACLKRPVKIAQR